MNKNTFKFLVVDDVKEDNEMICTCIAALKHDVYSANSTLTAFEALSIAQVKNSQYDFIVADYKLGETLDGMKLLAFTKKVYPDIVRIIISNHLDLEEAISDEVDAHYIIYKFADLHSIFNKIIKDKEFKIK